jgi:hypothetical protein
LETTADCGATIAEIRPLQKKYEPEARKRPSDKIAHMINV